MTAKTLLIGSGQCACRIAEKILAQGSNLTVASNGAEFGLPPDSAAAGKAGESAVIFTKTRVISCRGSVGDFKVILDRNGEKQIAAVDQIVIAEDDKRTPQFSPYGLRRTDSVISLSGLRKILLETAPQHSPFSNIKTVAFLVGLDTESNPVIFREVMQACIELQTTHALQTYILTGNLKVAAEGLERMYREAKKAGVIFIKFTATRPDVVQSEDGRVNLEFADEISGIAFRLAADMTIVDDRIAPSDYAADLARIFELDQDPNGFAQGENVHRLPVFTNRKGILTAGPSRSVQSISDQRLDAANAVLSLRRDEHLPDDPMVDKAGIDTGKCIRCLTCYRLCPHRAVQVNTRVSIASQACEGCGICIAECPREAISFENSKKASVRGIRATGETQSPQGSFVPSITAFCCRRSAARAAELAACMGKAWPQGLRIVEVPCGGGVSLDHILTAFESNADGVLVLTCHPGNCHSEQGPEHARQRVAQIKALFKSIGLESDRLAEKTLASNMGAEFAMTLAAFEDQLLKLGPTRLKA